MILLDILFDIFIAIYTSLGFGTPQHKINTKMDKLAKYSPELYNLYISDKDLFENDEKLSTLIFKHPVKSKEDKEKLVDEIRNLLNINRDLINEK